MRYIILVILNMPIILLALLNIVTQYKMKHATIRRFRRQVVLWLLVLIVIIGSFPFYNYLSGNPLLSSKDLSVFDIVEVTLVIDLFYIINVLRQRLDHTEKYLRDLQQELSIKLSEDRLR